MRALNNILFLFHFSFNISKKRFLSAGISICINAAEPFINLIFPMYIMNELTGNKNWNTVLFYIVLFIATLFILRALKLILQVFINMTINACDVKTGLHYAHHFLEMDYDKLEDGHIRDMQQKVSYNIRANQFVETLSDLLTNIIKLIGFSYMISMLKPIILLLILFIIIVNYFINKKINDNKYEYQPILARFSRMFDYIFQTMSNFDFAKEIRINNAKEMLSQKFSASVSDFNLQNKSFLLKQLAMNLLIPVSSLIQTIISYGYAAYSAMIGKITIGAFSMYIGAIYNLSGAFHALAANLIDMKYLADYTNEYYKYVDLALPKNKVHEIAPLPEEKNDLPLFTFENVSFIYPNTENIVLKNVSIQIEKGEKLSIVGLNGAGKTTFIKLLCRLYIPTEGCIKYYGIDISTINREEYLKQLAVVFQDFKIFSFSFRDNLVLNQPMDELKVKTAVSQAGLDSKLESLSKGLETNIFKDFDENGIEFSGGEGQKLVIARACYKNAALVILDEPTAALDAIAEYELYQKYSEIVDGKTSIFISHRLASTRFCDSIAVFNAGEIVEYGDHRTLMEENGLYCEMFEKQSKHYNAEKED